MCIEVRFLNWLQVLPPPPSLVFVTTPSCDVQSVSPLFTNTDDQRLTVEVH